MRNWHSVFFPDAGHMCSASSAVSNGSGLGSRRMLAQKEFRESLKLGTVSGSHTACQLENSFEECPFMARVNAAEWPRRSGNLKLFSQKNSEYKRKAPCMLQGP